MNPNRTQYRKLAYLAGLALLAFPMAWLGMPSSTRNGVEDAGGKLSQIRKEARLGQSDLGAIDPGSETIRMATLGLRGIAVTMLWSKANEYKKTEDWTAFQSTLEQLARLQPYFVKVWQYQAWNLSYNVSVEVDNVRDRFYYVKQGIEYLQDGIRYLRNNPVLLDDLGWFCGNKVGKADEQTMYRELFRRDEDLHPATRPLEERDNWLVSKEWYDEALRVVDSGEQSLGQKNPTTFFDSPARSQISYAEAIEKEGVFGERARSAWKEGARLWNIYANRDLKSTDGFYIKLADEAKWNDEVVKLRGELNALSPGLEAKMRQEAQAQLTPEMLKAWQTPSAEPTAEESNLQQKATEIMTLTPAKIAARIAKDDPAKAGKAQRLADDIHGAERRASLINLERDTANFLYWRTRCDLEQTPEALEAHRLAHAANLAFRKQGDPKAQQLYEASFDAWAKALELFPELPADSSTGSDILDIVQEYAELLDTLELSMEDEEVANRFPLWHIVEANDGEAKFAAALTAREARLTGRKPDSKSLIDPADALID